MVNEKPEKTLTQIINELSKDYHLSDTEFSMLYSNAEKIIENSISKFRIRYNDYEKIAGLMEFVYKEYFNFALISCEYEVMKAFKETPNAEIANITIYEIEDEALYEFMDYLFMGMKAPKDNLDYFMEKHVSV